MLSSSLNTLGAVPKKPSILSMATSPGATVSLGSKVSAPTKSSGILNVSQSSSTSGMPGNNPGLIKATPPVPTPSSALKKTTTNNVDGSSITHEYHAPLPPDDPSHKFNAITGEKNPNYKDPNIKPEKPATSTNPVVQAENLGQAGRQTSNESDTQRKLLESGAVTDWENAIKSGMAVEEANKRLSDFRTKVASQYGKIESDPIPLEFQQGREQALARQYASTDAALQTGVSNALTNQSQQFAAAQAQAARGANTAGQAYSGAQTQAGRGLSAQGQVFNAGLLQPTSIGQVPFSPVTGEQGGMIGGQGGLAGLGALQQQQDQGAQTQTMIGAYNQAKPLIETAKQQIANAGFNISPLALVNQLQQYVNKNVIPSGEYANIFNTLSEIATTISPVLGAQGAQTDLKTMISQEFLPKLLQGGDIASVLDNIEKNALAKIEANKATAQGVPLTVPQAPTGSNAPITWDTL